ncbi:hypothetical protein HMPREF0496_1069 [Lentilactobacillus hilgardii ATCC 27305]|nr:hypothetical protein HMPREF0496_1069 [Lentilactobacillus hilgardii ATCC 27305]
MQIHLLVSHIYFLNKLSNDTRVNMVNDQMAKLMRTNKVVLISTK